MSEETAQTEETEDVYRVPARALAQVVDPFAWSPWFDMSTPVTRAEIAVAIHSARTRPEPVDAPTWRGLNDRIDEAQARAAHVSRIAHFVLNPTDDPISIDVGVPSLGVTPVGGFSLEDGHHRLSSALYRDADIDLTFSGSEAAFRALFPNAVRVAPATEPTP